METRDRILAAIRSATHGAIDPGLDHDYRKALDAEDLGEHADVVDLFVERVGDYRAEVHVLSPEQLPLRIGQILGEHRVGSLVIPADLDTRWFATTHARLVRDGSGAGPGGAVTAPELDEVDAVVTGCAAAVALTGTIVLDSGPLQGRRLISLVPDLHVCVVPAEVIVGSVPEAVRAVDPTRPLTWISGPSATSDIELDRVEGVHGPRTLVVLVVR